MTTLNGDARPVELGQGIVLVAPGLRGRADVHDVTGPSGTRAPEVDGSGSAMREAFDATGISPVRVITLDVAQAPSQGAASSVRSVDAGDDLVLDVPDLGVEVAQVLMHIDEGGVVTFHFPTDSPVADTPAVRGAGGRVRFVVPAAPVRVVEEGGDRGLLGYVGRKVLELLAVPLGPWALQPVARLAAAHWEKAKRKVRVRGFDVESYRSGDVPDLGPAGWESLRAGRSLWFVHGTFSSAHGGFGGLPADTLGELHRMYDGRVVAFDHHTLSVDPTANVATLAGLVPVGLRPDADIVAHSRGGLVARALAGPGSPLSVRRVVYVGTPNHGTALADPAHLKELLSRVATMLNLCPPGPVSVVADSMSVVLSVVAIIAQYGLPALPGLASMDPRGEFLTRLNTAPADGTDGYAVAAEFEPIGKVSTLVRARDTATDAVFSGRANDLVVPTSGVFDVGTRAGSTPTTFSIAADHRLVLPASRGVDHSNFFGQSDVAKAIVEWLVDA